jgi:hypothetical protein
MTSYLTALLYKTNLPVLELVDAWLALAKSNKNR